MAMVLSWGVSGMAAGNGASIVNIPSLLKEDFKLSRFKSLGNVNDLRYSL